jgi:hypothetical protein
MELHIIYTEKEMVLSKERFDSWREVQDQYADYKTSLGPWDHEAVVEYLEDEYSKLSPSAAIQVAALLETEARTCVLTFQ